MRKYRKPYRIMRKKSILKNRFFWLSILVLTIFGGIFYLVCFSSFFQIKEIKITVNSAPAEASADKQKVLTQDLERIIQNQIPKNLTFFSTKSIFLVNLDEINKIILENFPQIAKINLKRDFPDTLRAEIEERGSVAIFCQNENCFLIDKNGIIFEKISELDPQKLKIQNQNLSSEMKLGERVTNESIISKILEIGSKLNSDLKIPLKEAVIISEQRLNVITVEGWEIYLNLKGDAGEQLTKLRVVLEEKIPPEKRKDLEYVDLRFSRVYYKYR